MFCVNFIRYYYIINIFNYNIIIIEELLFYNLKPNNYENRILCSSRSIPFFNQL
jgi:hypothetical protein